MIEQPGLEAELAGPPPTTDQPPTTPPSARAAVSRSFDLVLRASGPLRSASIYIGVQAMALVGPLAILGLLAFTRVPEFGELFATAPEQGAEPRPEDAALLLLIVLAGLVAIVGFIALAVDSQLIAVALLAGESRRQRLTLREAVIRARQTFWTVTVASFLIGIPIGIVGLVVGEVLAPILGPANEATTLLASAVGTLLGLPFGYVVAGVVLGEVDSVETIRRSVRLARARWRLAFVIALFGAAIGYIQLFALGAGGDILVRIATSLGLGLDGGPATTFLTLCVLLAGLLALGSLTMTIAALIAAPQVVSFLGLTGYAGGLERARERARTFDSPAESPPRATLPATPMWGPATGAPRPRFQWVTIPMIVGIVLGVLVSLAGIANVADRV